MPFGQIVLAGVVAAVENFVDCVHMILAWFCTGRSQIMKFHLAAGGKIDRFERAENAVFVDGADGGHGILQLA